MQETIAKVLTEDDAAVLVKVMARRHRHPAFAKMAADSIHGASLFHPGGIAKGRHDGQQGESVVAADTAKTAVGSVSGQPLPGQSFPIFPPVPMQEEVDRFILVVVG